MNWNRQYAKFVISIWLENTIWIFGGMTPEPSKIVKRCRHYMWTRNIKMGISEILSKRTHFSLLIFILRLLPKHIHTFRCFKTWNHGQIQSKGSGWFDIRYISKSRFYVHHKSSVYSKINCSILFSKFLIFFFRIYLVKQFLINLSKKSASSFTSEYTYCFTTKSDPTLAISSSVILLIYYSNFVSFWISLFAKSLIKSFWKNPLWMCFTVLVAYSYRTLNSYSRFFEWMINFNSWKQFPRK